VSIIFDPKAMLKKIAPESKVKKLLKGNLTLKKTALTFVDRAADTDVGVLDKSAIQDVALKVISSYQQRRAKAIAEDDFEQAAGNAVKAAIVADPVLLIQRVQNEIIFQVHDKIKTQYGGQKAVWLPSDAQEPRPEHQLNYGKEYVIGEGIGGVEPGDEYGCQCGVEILTSDDELSLT
jgi:hypothetical protein